MEKTTATTVENFPPVDADGVQVAEEGLGMQFSTSLSNVGIYSKCLVDPNGSKPSTFDPSATKENQNPEVVDYSGKAQNKTKFSDYLRIFTYSTTLDRIFLGIAVFGEIG